MSQWDDCDESDLCDEGFVCDDDSYGNCQEQFPTVFWVFQLVFICLFIAQCIWACCDHRKKTAEKSKPSGSSHIAQQHQVVPTTTPTPDTPIPVTDNQTKDQLPKEWTQCFTQDGKIYYQNNLTQTTQWERPTETIPLKTVTDALPDEWVEISTPDGKTYYQNSVTKTTQWERPTKPKLTHPVTAVAPIVTTNSNENTTSNEYDWEYIDYHCGAFIEFPFSTTCRNYLIRLLSLMASMTAFLFAYMLPSCCPNFYDSDYSAPDCCSWYGTNYLIYIFSWFLFVWYCLSGLYLVVVKKQEMTWISSSSYTTGNVEHTTTTVTTSSNVCYNIFMLILQAGLLCFAMVILPAIMGGDCQNYYC